MARSVPFTEPLMMFECLPLGGLWPEIVFEATWLLSVTITAAAAVPPRATNSAASETTLAKVRWERSLRRLRTLLGAD